MDEPWEKEEERTGEPVIQPIIDLGSSLIQTERGTIYVLTIVGQIEGHQVLPPSSKSTKYEHVLPLLATVEESPQIDGLLILLNNGGGMWRLGWPFRNLSPLCLSRPFPLCWAGATRSGFRWRFRPNGLSLRPRLL